MRPQLPFTQDLVMIGGGHAHALVLRAWGMDPLPGARLTVVNPGPTAPYTGMLPGHIAGHYARQDLEIDLVRLCQHAGARLILDRATGLDPAQRQVFLQDRGAIAYDVASLDVGITAQMDVPGFAQHGTAAKPLDIYAARWRAFCQAVQAGDRPAQIAVIGGGVAGCELAMAMAHGLPGAKVTVLEQGPQISGVGDKARAMLIRRMADLGIALRYGVRIARIAADHVALAGQDPVPAAFCVGAAGATPHPWLAQTGLPLHHGFVQTDPDLSVTGQSRLFAVGDCAHMGFAPRPKAGVFAVRAAPVLHHNLRAALSGQPCKHFRPQRAYLKLISLGGKEAMAEKFGRALAGPLLWRWKDRIDRAFMARLGELPQMPAPPMVQGAKGLREMQAAAPLCGGCGAKVGHGVLAGMLADLPAGQGDVLAASGDDAAILRQPGGGFQVISTDHLRGFVTDPALMARIALVHALGDVWAMGAAPQAVLSSIVLPQMSAALQARTLAEMTQAIRAVAQDVGAQVVGGHTTMGAELTVGFTVTGTRADMPLTVGGAQPGDRLVLTRPIGSGVILAAHMQGHAQGPDVARLVQRMAAPQHHEAAVLGAVAHSMTDVTGFGLAGHLAAMARASGVDVVIEGAQVPLYPGAAALSSAGVASSLMPSNRADVAVQGQADPLLFDPQTAGGLLAAVPPDRVDAVLAELADAGCTGHVIGSCQPGPGLLQVR